MNIIEVEDISKIYTLHPQNSLRISLRYVLHHLFRRASLKTTTFTALSNINFSVKKGETVGIIGPNGSGKSTLLRILAGIIYPSHGKVILKGTLTPLLTLGLGFHLELTGRENIYLNAAILGYSEMQVEREIENIIAFAGIEQFIDIPMKYYSSGMSARLGFAIATAKNLEPDILLIDETLAVGDVSFHKKSFERMKELAKSKKTTILFVSHDMKSIREICTSVLVIEKGEISDYGETKKVVKNYLKKFT